MQVPCPSCNGMVAIPFPSACPHCGATFDGVMGRGTSSFQTKNYQQHRDLLYGRNIQLYKGKQFNASFDYFGDAMLPDLACFTLSYGHRTTVTSTHGGHPTSIIAAYVPEIIGSGTYKYNTSGYVPCSGLVLMSPASLDHSHSYPVLDLYVTRTFGSTPATCTLCGKPSSFGHGICDDCYSARGNDWLNFL